MSKPNKQKEITFFRIEREAFCLFGTVPRFSRVENKNIERMPGKHAHVENVCLCNLAWTPIMAQRVRIPLTALSNMVCNTRYNYFNIIMWVVINYYISKSWC